MSAATETNQRIALDKSNPWKTVGAEMLEKKLRT